MRPGVDSLSQIFKYQIIIIVTILPVAALLVVVYITSYRPVFTNMENVVYGALNDVQPIQKLHISLLKALMSPNDFLIHGSESEIESWKRMKSEVDKAIEYALKSVRFESEQQVLLELREKWKLSGEQGDRLFMLYKHHIANPEAAEMMEQFDESVAELSRDLAEINAEMDKDIQQNYNKINALKYRAVAVTMVAIFLGGLVGTIGSIWLTKDRARIFEESMRDALTGVYNRRALTLEMEKLQKYQQAYNPPSFAILMMDIDMFKSVNDQYGHDAGDVALKHLAQLSVGQIRSNDIFGRYGGEEFLLLLPGTPKKEGIALAERIRQSVAFAKIPLPDGQGEFDMTVSIGVSMCDEEIQDVSEAVTLADKALYEAKRAGRNCVVAV